MLRPGRLDSIAVPPGFMTADGHLMDHSDPTPVSRAIRLRLRALYKKPFGQRLRGDFRQNSGPELTPSPGRWRLKSLLTLPFNVVGSKVTARSSKYKHDSMTLCLQYFCVKVGL